MKEKGFDAYFLVPSLVLFNLNTLTDSILAFKEELCLISSGNILNSNSLFIGNHRQYLVFPLTNSSAPTTFYHFRKR